MKEFAFAVKMCAIARVSAETEAGARKALSGYQAVTVNVTDGDVTITEASIDDTSPLLLDDEPPLEPTRSTEEI